MINFAKQNLLVVKNSSQEVLRSKTSGFTLVEMMITVVVLGILAAIAVPQYTRTIQRSYWKEAQDLLLTIYTGERAYYLTNTMYSASLTKFSGMAAWRTIFMDDPNLGSIPVDFSVSTSPSTFTATAARTSSPCSGSTITINQNRSFSPDPTTTPCWCSAC